MTKHTQYELPFSGVEDSCSVSPASLPTNIPLRETEQAIVDQALEILRERHQHGVLLSSPEVTKDYLRLKLADEKQEIFGCIFLTNRHRVIGVKDLFFGTIDGATVHSRIIVQQALFCNAAALVAYHNHPSGCADPSQADIRMTDRIRDALALVDIRLLDHFVVSAEECVSFADRGLL
jgi:DNA repair protein RadC